MPRALLLSCGAPTAMVLPSLLIARPMPVCPGNAPPSAKWSDIPGFEALRYAVCLRGADCAAEMNRAEDMTTQTMTVTGRALRFN